MKYQNMQKHLVAKKQKKCVHQLKEFYGFGLRYTFQNHVYVSCGRALPNYVMCGHFVN